MEFLIWIVLGALVGWIASLIMKTDADQGTLANILIGISGAVLGGFLWRTLTGDEADSLIGQILVALVGAMLIIAVWKALRRPSSSKIE
jgi:uncharacterized membrane protein YeaQ/YmgE (transglycosylase-associated protein family)